MKPLNQSERSRSLTKFILANIGALLLIGYSLYSFVFVKNNITVEDKLDTTEIKSMEGFLDQADTYHQEYIAADNGTDRAQFSIALNRLILDSRPSFTSNGLVFDKVSELYKDALKAQENIVNMKSNLGSSCQDQIKEIEEEKEELQKQVDSLEDDVKELNKDSKDSSNDLKEVKSALKRISRDLVATGDDIADRDWCKGLASGSGKKEIKSELKQRILGLRNEILSQASEL